MRPEPLRRASGTETPHGSTRVLAEWRTHGIGGQDGRRRRRRIGRPREEKDDYGAGRERPGSRSARRRVHWNPGGAEPVSTGGRDTSLHAEHHRLVNPMETTQLLKTVRVRGRGLTAPWSGRPSPGDRTGSFSGLRRENAPPWAGAATRHATGLQDSRPAPGTEGESDREPATHVEGEADEQPGRRGSTGRLHHSQPGLSAGGPVG